MNKKTVKSLIKAATFRSNKPYNRQNQNTNSLNTINDTLPEFNSLSSQQQNYDSSSDNTLNDTTSDSQSMSSSNPSLNAHRYF